MKYCNRYTLVDQLADKSMPDYRVDRGNIVMYFSIQKRVFLCTEGYVWGIQYNVIFKVLDEFFRSAFRMKFFESLESLQIDLDKWLHYYNYERPHRGYRNRGQPTL